MTINKAYLGALRATVTYTDIPVMNPRLYNMFPGPPETFSWHIGSFPGPFLMEILIFSAYSWSVESFSMSSYMFPGSQNRFPEPPDTCLLYTSPSPRD